MSAEEATFRSYNSSLYLLVFPEHGFLKIGKANNVHMRCKTLKKWWGRANYQESFELIAPQKIVLQLEKSLHFLLSSHNVNAPSGDGYTEMFALSSLDLAIKHIELFMQSGSIPVNLIKGILVSEKDITTPKETKLVNFKIPIDLYKKLKYLGGTTYNGSMTSIVVNALEKEVGLLMIERGLMK